MNLNLVAVAAALDQTNQQILRFGCGAQMDLRRQYAQNGAGPGVTPLPVRDHLTLVDDRCLKTALQIQLFRRGGHVGILLPAVFLLAGGKAAIHAGVEQRLLSLQGQKPERG